MTYLLRHFAVHEVAKQLVKQVLLVIYSSIAQSVEHAAVNRAVVGSSPTRGVFFYGISIGK